MKIISQAPTRIGLIGGGTDVNPFAYDYGGKIISLAINLRHITTLTPRKDKLIKIKALDQKRKFSLSQKFKFGEDKDFDLIRIILKHFQKQFKTGFDLSIKFTGLSTSGLGTSASAAVSIIGVINTWLNLELSRIDIAMLAWVLENNQLEWITGKQDQLAAAFGGINMLYFGPGDRVGIEKIDFTPKELKDLRDRTLLMFLGQTRSSGKIQKKLVNKMNHFIKQKSLFALKDGVNEAYKSIKKNDYIKLGKILDEIWVNKKTSNPSVSNSRIDKIYSLGLKNGSLGGKVMGAGGGGHMFLFTPPDKQIKIKQILTEKGVKFIDFNYDFEGLKVTIKP
jgi:D-glycero-alpha-D-manno-heptose-7-phosphate kinase